MTRQQRRCGGCTRARHREAWPAGEPLLEAQGLGMGGGDGKRGGGGGERRGGGRRSGRGAGGRRGGGRRGGQEKRQLVVLDRSHS